jgi:hypothetical protein
MEKINIMISLYSEDPAEPAFGLFRGLFPVCALCSGPGLTVLQPAPGIVLQLLGQAAQPPEYMRSGTVMSYGVRDLQAAVALAESRGATILQGITEDCAGFSFCYLQLPAGLPFGLFTSN